MALYAFDGTGDDDRGMGTDEAAIAGETNVWKFYQAYKSAAPKKQNVYKEGLGTRFGPIGAVIGLPFGAGWISRIHEAYDTLCENYLGGDDEIDVVGFSRGSALALGFINKVHDDGIRRNDTVVVAKPRIRYVALFDVVAAFGPGALGGPLAHLQPLHKLTLPDNVDHCYHAMALDERRFSFDVTRVRGAYEVWFRGGHCDIGGSNHNLGLSNIALRWMWHKAILCDLPITEANLNVGRDGCSPTDPINPAPASRAEKIFFRSIKPGDLMHYTVAQHIVLPDETCNDVPPGAPVETVEDEATRRDAPALQT
jgi:type VI secretion system (T6SS) phospholipase Tle1-like effector